MSFIQKIKPHYLLAFILALALGIRLIYVYQISASPLLEVLLIDSHYYDQTGQIIATGSGTEQRIFFMNPFYTYFLGLIYWLFERNWIIPCLIQAFTGTLTCALIYAIGRQLLSQSIGLIAAGLAALYGTFVFYDGALLTANPIVFFNLISLWCLLSWYQKQKPIWLIGAGIALGLSATGRGLILMFAIMLPFWFYLQNKSWQTILTRWIYVLFGIALILVPVGLRNWAIGGEFAMTPSGTGMAFYVGNHPSATGIYKNADFLTSAEPQHEFDDYFKEARRRSGKELTHDQAAWFWIEEGFRFIFNQPKAYIRLQIQKIYMFWNRTEAPNNLSYYFAHDFAPVLHVLIIGWGIIAPLGIVGLYHLSRTPDRWLIYLYVSAYFLACFIFFVTAEYRLPIAPILMLGAAYFVTTCYTFWKQGEKTRLITSIFIALILAVPINYQTTFAHSLTRKRIDYFNFGTLYKREGNLEKAEQLFKKSVEIDPTFALGHRALAEVYQQTGNIDAMLAANRRAQLYDQGLHSKPNVHQKAIEAFRNQRYDIALKYFEEVIKTETPRPEHYNNIGLCYYRLEQPDQAENAYLKAIELHPAYAKAHFNLAIIYLNTNRQEQAEQSLLETLKHDSKHTKAQYRLAELYTATHRPDAAIKMLQTLLQAFPDDPKLTAKLKSLQNSSTATNPQ